MDAAGYFAHCTSLEEARATWRGLASRFHPDRDGGDAELLKEINAEYTRIVERGTVRSPEGKIRPVLSERWYPIERSVSALLDPRRPVWLLSVHFTGGRIVGLCPLTGRGRAWAAKLDLSDYEDLIGRTLRSATGGCQVLVTETELNFLKSKKV